jgi:ATP-dependent DNA helicase RecQ
MAHELSTSSPAFSYAALRERLPEMPESRLKVCLNLLKQGRLLRQDRKLAYLLGRGKAEPARFAALAQDYAEKQERDRAALEQMVAYAQSGYCRWKLLLDYFGDDNGIERCGSCDNCVSPPAIVDEPPGDGQEHVHAGEALLAEDESPAPHFFVGDKVRVPKFDIGTVTVIEGDKITVAFAQEETRTFMAEFVQLLEATSPSAH